MKDLHTLLTNLGYIVKDIGKAYQTNALYRGGDNSKALVIYKDNGDWRDFVLNKRGSIEELIQLTLGLKDITAAKDYLQNNKLEIKRHKAEQPEARMEKFYTEENTGLLLPHSSWWEKRNISKETLVQFKGGLCTAGKMYNRYVFPIYNENQKILGYAARDMMSPKSTSFDRPKWKLIGKKDLWVYPLFLNHQIINEKREVILVESVGDMLALFEAGIKNVIVLFGIAVKKEVLKLLIGLTPCKVMICTNNDSDNNNVGNRAAFEIKSKLLNFIDKANISIKLPSKKDFGDMDKKEILDWYNN